LESQLLAGLKTMHNYVLNICLDLPNGIKDLCHS
jgi:hypothetical protein